MRIWLKTFQSYVRYFIFCNVRILPSTNQLASTRQLVYGRQQRIISAHYLFTASGLHIASTICFLSKLFLLWGQKLFLHYYKNSVSLQEKYFQGTLRYIDFTVRLFNVTKVKVTFTISLTLSSVTNDYIAITLILRLIFTNHVHDCCRIFV